MVLELAVSTAGFPLATESWNLVSCSGDNVECTVPRLWVGTIFFYFFLFFFIIFFFFFNSTFSRGKTSTAHTMVL